MNCSNCTHPLSPRSVTLAAEPQNGDLLLCPDCGHLSVVIQHITGSPSTRPLLESEYYALSREELTDLTFAIRVIQARHAKEQRKLILPPWFSPS